MEKELTIQQVAEITGLSPHTLRYYERCQLIAPIERTSSGHRRYSTDDIRWIEFLTRLRSTGMPIRQMQAYSVLVRQHPKALEQRRRFLETHRQTVREQIERLQENLAVIDWKIQHYAALEAQESTNGLFEAP
ncbi:MAG: MerR family transcriptional regulator [Cyanobacteria bacterium P01_A01_bin.3]